MSMFLILIKVYIITELDTSNNEAITTFEFDGDISSYYWSNYKTCRSDMKKWTNAWNNMLDENASIFTLFQHGQSELCFNPGGCQTGVELMSNGPCIHYQDVNLKKVIH